MEQSAEEPSAALALRRPCTTMSSTSFQENRALLGARKQLKLEIIDLKQTARGPLCGFGPEAGNVSRGKLSAGIR